MSTPKRRHKWGEPTFTGPEVRRWDCPCGVRRYKQPGLAFWFAVPSGQRFRFVDAMPSCQPSQENP
jgi:hypothetical protein